MPVNYASIDGGPGKVKNLVEAEHVDPHSCRDGKNDDTLLHCASYYGHLDIVRYLVEEQQCDVECTLLNEECYSNTFRGARLHEPI